METSHFVNAPPRVVIEVFTDINNMAERVRLIRSVEVLTSGAIGVGTRYRVRYTDEWPTDPVIEWTFLEFDRPSKFTIESAKGSLKYQTVYHFIPENDGTRVRITSQVRPATALGYLYILVLRLIHQLAIEPALQKEKDVLDDLAQTCERLAGVK